MLIKLAAILASAASFGGMLFFAAVMAPLVFAKLPAPTASQFIRQVFPIYYVVMAGATALAAACATAIAPADALVLAMVSIGFLFARVVMLPRLDTTRERARGGDKTAERQFRHGHRD